MKVSCLRNNKQFYSKIPCRCILKKKGMLCLTSWIQVALKDRLSPAIKALHNLCDDLPIRLFGLAGGLQERKKHLGVGRNMRRLKIRENKRCIVLFIHLKMNHFSRSYIHMVDYGKVFRTVVSKRKTSLFLKCVLFHMERLSNPPVCGDFLMLYIVFVDFLAQIRLNKLDWLAQDLEREAFAWDFRVSQTCLTFGTPSSSNQNLLPIKTRPHTKNNTN